MRGIPVRWIDRSASTSPSSGSSCLHRGRHAGLRSGTSLLVGQPERSVTIRATSPRATSTRVVTLPLVADPAARTSRPSPTAAFAGDAPAPSARSISAAADEQQRRRGAGRDSCICPAERKTARRRGPPCRSPRYEQPSCQSPLSACEQPDPAAVRKRSQAHRLGAGGEHSGSRRPGRRAAPCSKGIVTSAATRRALRHDCSSRVDRVAETDGDRRIVLFAQLRW